jgi:hypothetical protein
VEGVKSRMLSCEELKLIVVLFVLIVKAKVSMTLAKTLSTALLVIKADLKERKVKE